MKISFCIQVTAEWKKAPSCTSLPTVTT